MGDEWIVFERGHRYQIGRYYFGLFHVQKIEWYFEAVCTNPPYGTSTWQTSTKELAMNKAKEINMAIFNRKARAKAFDEDHWKEVT